MFGIHTALVTPFDARGEVDVAAFERAVARQLAAGIHGLVPCGTTGETPTLSTEEQDLLVRSCLEQAGGRVPVTAGIGSNDTRGTVRRAEQVAALGAQAGLLVFPYYNKPNPEGLRAHVREVARVGLPLVLYHVPGRTGQLLPAPLVAELSSMPGVIALKEATGDLRYGGDVITRTSTPVLSGDDFSFLGLMAQGAAGCISVVSNVDPVRTVGIHDAVVAGQLPRAQRLLNELWPLITFLFADSNPVPCKAALAALGLGRAEPRLPLAVWSGPSPAPLLAELGLLPEASP